MTRAVVAVAVAVAAVVAGCGGPVTAVDAASGCASANSAARTVSISCVRSRGPRASCVGIGAP